MAGDGHMTGTTQLPQDYLSALEALPTRLAATNMWPVPAHASGAKTPRKAPLSQQRDGGHGGYGRAAPT